MCPLFRATAAKTCGSQLLAETGLLRTITQRHGTGCGHATVARGARGHGAGNGDAGSDPAVTRHASSRASSLRTVRIVFAGGEAKPGFDGAGIGPFTDIGLFADASRWTIEWLAAADGAEPWYRSVAPGSVSDLTGEPVAAVAISDAGIAELLLRERCRWRRALLTPIGEPAHVIVVRDAPAPVDARRFGTAAECTDTVSITGLAMPGDRVRTLPSMGAVTDAVG
jgi:hypothetical protein